MFIYSLYALILCLCVLCVYLSSKLDTEPFLADCEEPGKLRHDFLIMKSEETRVAVLIKGGWRVNGRKAVTWSTRWKKRIVQKGKKLEGMPGGMEFPATSCSLLVS